MEKEIKQEKTSLHSLVWIKNIGRKIIQVCSICVRLKLSHITLNHEHEQKHKQDRESAFQTYFKLLKFIEVRIVVS